MKYLLYPCACLYAAGCPDPAHGAVPDDTVVAKVDGKDVTAGEIRQKYGVHAQ